MSTVTPVLVSNFQLPSATALLMAPVSTLTQITSAVLVNINSVMEAATIYLVRSGGGAGPASIVIDAQPIAPLSPYLCPELIGRNLNVGDALYGFATDGNQVNIVVDGIAIT